MDEKEIRCRNCDRNCENCRLNTAFQKLSKDYTNLKKEGNDAYNSAVRVICYILVGIAVVGLLVYTFGA